MTQIRTPSGKVIHILATVWGDGEREAWCGRSHHDYRDTPLTATCRQCIERRGGWSRELTAELEAATTELVTAT